jgi:transposase
MPAPIRVELNEEQRAELRRLARARTTAPRTRERLEMVRLAAQGWTIPTIARHLEAHEQTVRKYVKIFLSRGFGALPDRPRSGRRPRVTVADLDAVEQLLDAAARQGQTWTLPRLARWLAEHRGVRISAGRLGVLLNQRGFHWKRTKRSLRHQQADPALQAQARADLEVLTS